MTIHLRVHMPIGHKNVHAAIVVIIEKFHSETQKRHADGTKSSRAGLVSETAVVVVVVEIVGVVGEIGFDQIGPAVIIIIGAVHAHARLRQAISAAGYTGRHAHLRESAFAVVVIKPAGGRVVGDVEVKTAVFIVIQPNHAQAVVGVGIDPQFVADVREGAVPIIVV